MITTNATVFNVLIKDWIEDVLERRAPATVKATTRRLFKMVLELSPIDTGTFISQWRLSEGEPDTSTISESEMRASLASPAGRARRMTKEAEVDNFFSGFKGNKYYSFFMTNSLPYAEKVEFSYGYAPVEKTMQNAGDVVEIAIADALAGYR